MNLKTADRLVELRKSHKLSQEALSEKLGVSRQAISKWERGESSPDTDNLIALANVYGITLDELLNDEKEVKKHEEKAEDKTQEKTESKPSSLAWLGKKLFKFPFPLIIVAVYVALNLMLNLWHPTWVMFLLIPIYYHFAGISFIKSSKAFLLALPVPEIVIMLYLLIGLCFKAWGSGALVFIIIPIYYWVVAFYKKK